MNTALDERFPVWNALSDFFLDTELDSSDYDRIAGILAESPYSTEELRDILSFEVTPVCRFNLFSIAGEWSGFDPDWLNSRILPKKDKRPKWAYAHLHKWIYQRHWKKIADRIDAVRNKNSG